MWGRRRRGEDGRWEGEEKEQTETGEQRSCPSPRVAAKGWDGCTASQTTGLYQPAAGGNQQWLPGRFEHAWERKQGEQNPEQGEW